jgi:adenylosuccinate synthase
MTVDERALLATSFHGISSRLKELARKKNRRGIIGVGIGEASLDAELYPELAIYAADVKKPGLREKLRAVLEQKRQEIALLYENEFTTEDAGEVKSQLSRLRDDDFYAWVCEVFEQFAKEVRIVDAGYLAREIFSRDGSLVFESSHGVLTDRYYGFHPHTTRLRTVPQENAEAVLADGGWDEQVVRLGVMRSYQIKHGAGPFVVDTPKMAQQLLPEEVGNPDRYRGQVRVGPLDLVALRYARDVCGGASRFDGLCVTWCDTVNRLSEFKVCSSYDGAQVPLFFTEEGYLRVSHESGDEQLHRQERLGKILATCSPRVTRYKLPVSHTNTDTCRVVGEVLKEALGVPVRMAGFGPTEVDKLLF